MVNSSRVNTPTNIPYIETNITIAHKIKNKWDIFLAMENWKRAIWKYLRKYLREDEMFKWSELGEI